MAKEKIYKITIDGVEQSINAVEALTKRLDALDAKISELEKKKINVDTSGGNGTATRTLQEEAAIQKELNALKNEGTKLEAKQVAYQSESYQKVLAQKDILKEIVSDQKAIAAQERLQANVYADNTMQGMKQKLADLKAVINTTDLGDSDALTKMIKEANELNSKLLEVEKSYGQFGRQVGHYEIVNDGLGKIVIAVGGIEREFTNAREASRELSNELKTMAINGQQDTEAFKELQKAVLTLNSDIKDATVSSKAMDTMLDTMQSIVAIASTAKGISTVFGLDDSAIDQSIQKLLALQNALKGIESINQQLKSGEFMGGLFSKANSMIDEFAAKLTGAKTSQDALTTSTQAATVAQKELNTTNAVGATATNTLATAQKAQTVATKGATTATKALSMALKGIGIGLIVAAITALIALYDKYVDKLKEANKAHEEGIKAYAKAKTELMQYETRLKNFNGTKKEEKKIVDELNSKYGKALGQYKSVKQWQDALAKNGEAYCKILLKEAEVQALLNQYQEEYVKLVAAQEKVKQGDTTWVDKVLSSVGRLFGNISDSGQFAVRKIEQSMEKLEKTINEKMDEIDEISKKYKIGDYSDQIEKGTDKTKKAIEEEEKELSRLRIANMKEGLNKIIKQLEEERKQRLAKLDANSKNYKELEAEINKYYDKKIEDETEKHLEKIREAYKEFYDGLISYRLSYNERASKLNDTQANNAKGELAEDLQKGLMRQRIGSYGIQGKNQYSKTTQQYLGIFSTSNDKMVDDTKKLIELERDYERAATEAAQKKITKDEELKDSIQALKDNEEKYTHFYIEMNGERVNLTEEEYKKRRESILARTKDLDEELKIYKEVYGEESEYAKKRINEVLEERKKLASELTKLEGKRDLMTKEQYDALLDEEYHLYENEKKIQNDKTVFLEAQADKAKEIADEKLKLLEQEKQKYNEMYSSVEDRAKASFVKQMLEEENYSKSLGDLFNQRLTAIETYWVARTTNERQYIEKDYKNQLEILKNKHEQETRAENEHFDELVALNDSWRTKEREMVEADLENKKITKEKADAQLEAIDKKYYSQGEELSRIHANNLKDIDAQLEADQKAALNKKNEQLKKYNEEYFKETLQEFRDFQTALSNLESKQPVMNAWRFTNWTQTNKNNSELLKGYETLANEIIAKRKKINLEYEDGVIDKDVYESTLRELDSFSADLGEKMDKVRSEMTFGNRLGRFIQEAQQYINVLGDSLGQILSTIWSAADAEYDAMMDELEKDIDKYQEMLNKQEEITREHNTKVNDIEDELKTARGDRRQQLIDNLNAEMAAQRASLAQQKKIEKEQEKLKAKKENEEEAQREREKNRSITQAIISNSLAVVNALATQPFVPVGIAMGALAASLGLAQIAIMKSAKYAQGGLLEGKSHSEGGIKTRIGNTPIELEGNEYVIRKKTTEKNVQLLDYINKSERKLNIDDFIDFYSSGKVRKNIVAATPKARYADGGVLPSLRTDIEFNDRLLSAFEDYSNRPIVVGVQEIVDVNDRMNEVKVMAGLQPSNI